MTTFISALIGAGAGYAYYHYIGCISGTCPIQTNPWLSMIFGGLIAVLILPEGYNWLRKTWDEKRESTEASIEGQPSRATYANINKDEFFALKDRPDVAVLDVRTRMEWNLGHVEGATLLDINSSSFAADVAKLDTSKTWLVYCRSGRRSAIAAEIMIKNGFTNVKNVKTGQNGLF